MKIKKLPFNSELLRGSDGKIDIMCECGAGLEFSYEDMEWSIEDIIEDCFYYDCVAKMVAYCPFCGKKFMNSVCFNKPKFNSDIDRQEAYRELLNDGKGDR